MKQEEDLRFHSQTTRNSIAFILAGGRGSRLRQLTDWRAKPAVPFGGKFRIIDFALSNCVNSDLRRVYILTQYKALSLNRHIRTGWSVVTAPLSHLPATDVGDECHECDAGNRTWWASALAVTSLTLAPRPLRR